MLFVSLPERKKKESHTHTHTRTRTHTPHSEEGKKDSYISQQRTIRVHTLSIRSDVPWPLYEAMDLLHLFVRLVVIQLGQARILGEQNHHTKGTEAQGRKWGAMGAEGRGLPKK